MLHRRHPSLARNGNVEVEELRGWGWVLSALGPAVGWAALLQRPGVGRKTLRERRLKPWASGPLPPSWLPPPRSGAAMIGEAACTYPLGSPWFPHLWSRSTDAHLCSSANLWGHWCPELNGDLTPCPSLPSPGTILLPGLLLSQKWGGRKIPLVIKHTCVFSYVNAPDLFLWAASFSPQGQNSQVVLVSLALLQWTRLARLPPRVSNSSSLMVFVGLGIHTVYKRKKT